MLFPSIILTPKEFPPLLKEITDPPKKLHLRGTFPSTEKYLCVVGARKYTPYGKSVCEELIEGLRGLSVTVVSGLALGIDSIAHKAALSARLPTVAVPGSGLGDSVLYPGIHRALAKEILSSGGALLSEFEDDFKATVWSFPQRNRIMAGISHAVLVIEAEKKSGTLITARLASEYNRDVFTVPGSIFSANSTGPHLLIRLGATPVTCGADLREALGFKEEISKEKNYDDCSAEEKTIIALLREPLGRDDLIRKSKMGTSRAQAILSMLEIKGLIEETLGEIRLK
ncbi:MAG: DNA-processing protein DprA [Patescibacteria group bacterium]|nr:DNA-processing protein DprA [bacterium]MDZ4240761.1 DNA-processing protein DprA [Patescibacteria group bacterium]